MDFYKLRDCVSALLGILEKAQENDTNFEHKICKHFHLHPDPPHTFSGPRLGYQWRFQIS
jgi:hypothetical protein